MAQDIIREMLLIPRLELETRQGSNDNIQYILLVVRVYYVDIHSSV